MTTKQLLEGMQSVKPQKLGKEPVVILPLEDYEKIRVSLEALQEDLEMAQSKFLRVAIFKARSEKRLYAMADVKKLLKL